MSFLKTIEPKKEVMKFEITAYQEDVKLFKEAIELLELQRKGSVKFGHESLFEHLLQPLRQDQSLCEYVETKSKKKSRATKNRGTHAIKTEVNK